MAGGGAGNSKGQRIIFIVTKCVKLIKIQDLGWYTAMFIVEYQPFLMPFVHDAQKFERKIYHFVEKKDFTNNVTWCIIMERKDNIANSLGWRLA